MVSEVFISLSNLQNVFEHFFTVLKFLKNSVVSNCTIRTIKLHRHLSPFYELKPTYLEKTEIFMLLWETK